MATLAGFGPPFLFASLLSSNLKRDSGVAPRQAQYVGPLSFVAREWEDRGWEGEEH